MSPTMINPEINTQDEEILKQERLKEEHLLKPESEENQTQFQIIAHKIDKTKRKGAYYYLFKGGSSSVTFATIFADVIKEVLSYYFLPFLVFGSVYRTFLNIKESSLISSVNLNLYSKVFFNAVLAVVSVLAFVAVFIPTIIYATFLPFISCVAYAGKFITKVGLASLYLNRHYNSEVGTERRAEGIGRAKKYALSAGISFLALCVGVILGIANVATGGILNYILLGAAFAVGAWNSAYVVKLEFMENESTLPEEIEHMEHIQDEKIKKSFLVKLIDKKIKALNKNIDNLEKLQDRMKGREYVLCPMSDIPVEEKEGKFSESPEKFKLYLESENGQLYYRTNLMTRNMVLTREDCEAAGVKKERLDLLFKLLALPKEENFMTAIAEYKDDILKATKNKDHTYPKPTALSRAWNYTKYTVMNLFPRNEIEKKELLEDIKKSLEASKEQSASVNDASITEKTETQNKKTISEIATELENSPKRKRNVFSFSYLFGKQSETELFMQAAKKIEAERDIEDNKPSAIPYVALSSAIVSQKTFSQTSLSSTTDGSSNSSLNTLTETASQRDSEVTLINASYSKNSSKGFEYDEKIIDSLKKIECEENRKLFLMALITKKIIALKAEILKKTSKKRDNKIIFLEWLHDWLKEPSTLLVLNPKDAENEKISSEEIAPENLGALMNFLEKHPEFEQDIFSSYRNVGDTELLLKAAAIHLDMKQSEVTDKHKPGHKQGKFYFKDLMNTLKDIKNDDERKECLVKLLDKKILSLNTHIEKAKKNHCKLGIQKHIDKSHMLEWLKNWVKNGGEPTEFQLPGVYCSKDYPTKSNKIHNMKDLMNFLQFEGEYKPKNEFSFRGVSSFLTKSPQAKFRENVFSSLLESLGETDGLVRVVGVHLDKCNENKAKANQSGRKVLLSVTSELANNDPLSTPSMGSPISTARLRMSPT